MKPYIKLTNVLFIACIVLAALAACQDNEGPIIPSAVDEKQWEYDKNIDETYAPGDDFFMHCNGRWWNDTDLGNLPYKGFPIEEMNKEVYARLYAIPDPRLTKINTWFDKFGANQEEAERLIRERLHEYDGLSLVESAALFIKQGYSYFIELKVGVTEGGRIINYLDLSPSVGYSGGRTVSMPKTKAAPSPGRQRMCLEVGKNIYPVATQKTRAGSGDDFLSELAGLLEFGNGNIVYVVPAVSDFLNSEVFANSNEEQWKNYLLWWIGIDYSYTSRDNLSLYYGDITLNEFRESIIQDQGYLNMYTYTTHYVSASLREEYVRICEEFREAFRRRLEKMDWISEPTRSRALRKLDKMKLYVPGAEKWEEELLPALDGNSLVEDVYQLLESNFKLTKAMNGKKMEDAGLEYLTLEYKREFYENCSYHCDFNQVIMSSLWMVPPCYDPTVSDAWNYAAFHVIAHEITHGFDSNGSYYNEDGEMEDWWTADDRAEYEKRQQKLLDCFDRLEVFPDELPGVYTPHYCLGENIAELGGVLVAYDVYMNYLKRNGYHGEELEKQERRFFRGYAGYYRSKYNTDWLMYANSIRDPHPMNKERVNGIVMNIDRWYELFDVTPENKLYLSPEERTRLW